MVSRALVVILGKNKTINSHPNGNFTANIPILNCKNDENWCKQMKVVFCYQDIWDLVKNEVTPIKEDDTNEQKVSYKDFKKKYYFSLFIIHKCVALDNFKKVGDIDSSKETWDILEKFFGGDEKVKEVRLHTLKRTYERLHMEENERITDFFTRVIKLVNQLMICGEVLTSSLVVTNTLRSLTPKFDHVVVAIEE